MGDEIVFTFLDTRNAMAGERSLLAAGVEVRVMSRPSTLGDGCGICLRVAPMDRPAAEAALREAGVETEAVYCKRAGAGGFSYERL